MAGPSPCALPLTSPPPIPPSLSTLSYVVTRLPPSIFAAHSFILHPSALLPFIPVFLYSHFCCSMDPVCVCSPAPFLFVLPPFPSPYLPLPPPSLPLYLCTPPNLLITDPLLALPSPLPLILQAYVLEQRRGPSLCAYLCCPLSDGHVSVTCLISSATKMVTPLRSFTVYIFFFHSIFVCEVFFCFFLLRFLLMV